jgi:hypothetical protein
MVCVTGKGGGNGGAAATRRADESPGVGSEDLATGVTTPGGHVQVTVTSRGERERTAAKTERISAAPAMARRTPVDKRMKGLELLLTSNMPTIRQISQPIYVKPYCGN